MFGAFYYMSDDTSENAEPNPNPNPPAETVADNQPIPPAESVLDPSMKFDDSTPGPELVRQVRVLLRRDEAAGFAGFCARMEAIPRLKQMKLNDSGNFVALAFEATGKKKTLCYEIINFLPEKLDKIWDRVNSEADAATARGGFYEFPAFTTMVKWYKPGKAETQRDDDDADEAGEDEGEESPEDATDDKGNRSRKALATENLLLQDEVKKRAAQMHAAESRLRELQDTHDRLRQNHREQSQTVDTLRDQVAAEARARRAAEEREQALQARIAVLEHGDNVVHVVLNKADEPPPEDDPEPPPAAEQVMEQVPDEVAEPPPVQDPVTDDPKRTAKDMAKDTMNAPLPIGEAREPAFFAALKQAAAAVMPSDNTKRLIKWIRGLDAAGRERLFSHWDNRALAGEALTVTTPMSALRAAIWMRDEEPRERLLAQEAEMKKVVCPGEMEPAEVLAVEAKHKLKAMKRGGQSPDDWIARAVRAEYIVAHEGIMGTGIMKEDRNFWLDLRGQTVATIGTARFARTFPALAAERAAEAAAKDPDSST